LRRAALFTSTVTAFYGIALIAGIFLSIALTGSVFFPDLSTGAGLTYAGHHLPAVAIGYLADVVDGAIFTVPFVAVYAVLRRRWPVYAHLILFGGITALVLVTVKNLVSYDLASSLGPLYLSADAAHQAALLPLGTMAAAIRQGLQDADTYPILATLVVMALLPKAAGLSRWTKVMGILITVAFLLPFGPVGFFIASVITPAWAIPLAGWLKRTASHPSA
jgi:hypothetical protein